MVGVLLVICSGRQRRVLGFRAEWVGGPENLTSELCFHRVNLLLALSPTSISRI